MKEKAKAAKEARAKPEGKVAQSLFSKLCWPDEGHKYKEGELVPFSQLDPNIQQQIAVMAKERGLAMPLGWKRGSLSNQEKALLAKMTPQQATPDPSASRNERVRGALQSADATGKRVAPMSTFSNPPVEQPRKVSSKSHIAPKAVQAAAPGEPGPSPRELQAQLQTDYERRMIELMQAGFPRENNIIKSKGPGIIAPAQLKEGAFEGISYPMPEGWDPNKLTPQQQEDLVNLMQERYIPQ